MRKYLFSFLSLFILLTVCATADARKATISGFITDNCRRKT